MLKDMPLQEIFNKVSDHLITQGVPSVDASSHCMYRGANGTKCAAGIFLTDEQAAQFEDVTFIGVAIQLEMKLSIDTLDLMDSLQSCHDQASRVFLENDPDHKQNYMKTLKTFLDITARDYNLKSA